MLFDHDFHPDETTVRVFSIDDGGVLYFSDEMVVYEVQDRNGIVLRHYAFADHWYKVNVTTDLAGHLVETGDSEYRFAINCDIATPMETDGTDIYAVDLFADVLIRHDSRSYVVTDAAGLEDACRERLVSETERQNALAGLDELVDVVKAGDLHGWLGSLAPFGPCNPPRARDDSRKPAPPRLRPHHRRTW